MPCTRTQVAAGTLGPGRSDGQPSGRGQLPHRPLSVAHDEVPPSVVPIFRDRLNRLGPGGHRPLITSFELGVGLNGEADERRSPVLVEAPLVANEHHSRAPAELRVLYPSGFRIDP